MTSKFSPESPGIPSGTFHERTAAIEQLQDASMTRRSDSEFEAVRLRKEWMQIIGYTIEEIEESIRETPPIDVPLERVRLDGAKRMMAKPDLSASELTRTVRE